MNAINTIFTPLHRKVIEPGELYFGENEDVIFTLLGSCVAVTLWHPVKKWVGMCHAVLPSILPGTETSVSSNRYADCAIKKFIQEIKQINTTVAEYEVGVYGGANMFSGITKNNQLLVGNRNVKEIIGLLQNNHFLIKFKDVGSDKARKLTLSRKTGEIGLEYVTSNKS